MHQRPFENHSPQMGARVFIDPSAVVVGRVSIGDDSSLWPCAVARGDVEAIQIGARTSIQDGTVLHVTHDGPYTPGGRGLVIGDEVTVGHRVVLHACTVASRCLIGMGAVVMDDVEVGEYCLIAAGSVVPPGKVLPAGTLWRGTPAQQVRVLSGREREQIEYSAAHYVRLKDRHLSA